jgi:hypothetical protein
LIPAVELLHENVAAHLFPALAGLFLVLTFRKQVDRRLSPDFGRERHYAAAFFQDAPSGLLPGSVCAGGCLRGQSGVIVATVAETA